MADEGWARNVETKPDDHDANTWSHYLVHPRDPKTGVVDPSRWKTLCGFTEAAYDGEGSGPNLEAGQVVTDRLAVEDQLAAGWYVCPECEMRARLKRLEALQLLREAGMALVEAQNPPN